MAAAWSRWSEPSVPKFDAAERNRAVQQLVDELTPVGGWWVWLDVFRPLGDTGFHEMDIGPSPALRDQIARHRFFQATMLVLSAVCAAGAAVAAVSRRAMQSPPGR